MIKSYSLSHPVPVDKLLDGRLASCGIIEVNKPRHKGERHLWDGLNFLIVHPDSADHRFVGLISQTGKNEPGFILSKIIEFYAVDVYQEGTIGFRSKLPVGSAPMLFSHYMPGSPSLSSKLLADPDIVLDGRFIDRPPEEIVATQLPVVRAECIMNILSGYVQQEFPWLLITVELLKASRLLSADGYAMVLEETNIQASVAEKLLQLYSERYHSADYPVTFSKVEHKKFSKKAAKFLGDTEPGIRSQLLH